MYTRCPLLVPPTYCMVLGELILISTRRYNIQCPDENYDLHYSMVRFDIEPSDNDTCLDFLRKLLNYCGEFMTITASYYIMALPFRI